MSVGWKYGTYDGKPVAVRVCYVRAWRDPEWRRVNGLREEVRHGTQAGGTQPPAESQTVESMGVQR